MQCLIANKLPNFSKISTLAIVTVIAGLVRSPQNNSVHYRQSYRRMTVKVHVCTNIKHNQSLCYKCPPCARMQARKCGHHCLIASSMNTWWECFHSVIRRDFSWSTSCVRLRCFPTSGSLLGLGEDCWLATELER